MLSALVAIEGPLGDAVVRSLETACPRWSTQRVLPESSAGKLTDVVVVDEPLGDAGASLSRRSGARLLVLGRDIEKPFSVVALRAKALALVDAAAPDDSAIVAVDLPLRRALRVVDAAARRRASVLVTGPTGVGKELIARRIHERSGRNGAFVPINCAAVSEGLAESTLFGHARGAFTGAAGSVPGAFVEADGGTLFLDEVGELDLRLQARLLRALEDGSVRPLGAARPRSVDVRVVAATNRDLKKETSAGTFRSDLYFRLAAFVVQVAPLRERPADLAALIQRFVREHERSNDVQLTPGALEVLRGYAWPGNVRELKNVVERVLSLSPSGPLDADELCALAPELELASVPQPGGSIARREQQAIDDALREATGRRAQAAHELGIHRTTLWRKLKRRGVGA